MKMHKCINGERVFGSIADCPHCGIVSLRQEVERLNGLYGIIDGQKVIISELEAENELLRALTEWQPIETAPRDGTKILITQFREVKNHDDFNETYVCQDYIMSSYFRKHGQGKMEKNYKEGFYPPWHLGEILLNPTHWMPLPKAPQIEGK